MTTGKKIKLACLVLFILGVLVCIAFFVYFMVREQHRIARYEEAVVKFNEGDYESAEKMFREVVGRDPNNENAFVHLAKIMALKGDWMKEAFCWKKSMELNQLEKEYRDFYCRALAKARNFNVLATQFRQDIIENKELSDEHAFYCILSFSDVNGWNATKEFREHLKETHPEFYATDYGQFVTALGEIQEKREPDPVVLSKLMKSEDIILSYEANNIQAGIYRRQKNKEALETLLHQQAERNQYAGLQQLAYFHMLSYRFKDAAEEYQRSWELFHRPSDAITCGENLLLSEQKEALADFSKNFHANGQLGIQIGTYLECLTAFATGDDETFSKLMPQVLRGFGSPVTLLMAMYASVINEKTVAVAANWNMQQRRGGFYDFNSRYDKMFHGYIHQSLSKGRVDDAGFLLTLKNVDWLKDEACAQTYINYKLRKESLSEANLAAALKKYPDNLMILQSGAELYFRKNKMDECMKLIEHGMSLNPPANSPLVLLHVVALARMGRVDDAIPNLLEAIKANKKNTTLIRIFCGYCTEHNKGKEMEELANSWVDDPEMKGLRHYVLARRFILGKERDKALEELMSVETDDAYILFDCALNLAAGGRYEQAMKLYGRFLELYPTDPMAVIVKANMSEIHLELGKKEDAVAMAEEAWKMEPDNETLLKCYCGKLAANGNSRKLIETAPLGKVLQLNDEKLTAEWKKAAESEIVQRFENNEKWLCEELCLDLLKLDKTSSVALDYMNRIHPPEEENAKDTKGETPQKTEDVKENASDGKEDKK